MEAQNTTLQSPDNFHHTRPNRSTGDLREGHETHQRDSDFRGSFPAVCGTARERPEPPTGVLLKTSQPTQRHETKIPRQANERFRHAKRPGPARLDRKSTRLNSSH